MKIRFGKKSVFLGFLVLCFIYLWLPPTAEEVLEDFYQPGGMETGKTESMLANPLRAHADMVKMLVVEK